VGGEVAALAAEAAHSASAVNSMYNRVNWAGIQDDIDDQTVRAPRQLLQRSFGMRNRSEQLPRPVSDLAADPPDGSERTSLRLRVCEALNDRPHPGRRLQRHPEMARSS
jgi:hypothetical protein